MAVAAIDWDAWRLSHGDMDFRDQQAFYRLVAEQHPWQQHFSLDEAVAAFDLIEGRYMTVLELGGWDGLLASELLGRYSINRWTNFDIVGVSQICVDLRYSRILLTDYFWNRRHTADVFVATHTIEHLTGEEVALLFDSLNVSAVYLESPIDYEGRDWTGYPGSHILELGWREVGDLLRERGYSAVWFGQMAGLWAR